MRFNTSLLHAGVTKETNGSTLPPVYQTSAFEQESAADLEKIFENKVEFKDLMGSMMNFTEKDFEFDEEA